VLTDKDFRLLAIDGSVRKAIEIWNPIAIAIWNPIHGGLATPDLKQLMHLIVSMASQFSIRFAIGLERIRGGFHTLPVEQFHKDSSRSSSMVDNDPRFQSVHNSPFSFSSDHSYTDSSMGKLGEFFAHIPNEIFDPSFQQKAH
jgi:hypothetical protein